jgi:hypothetical protein
MSQPAMESTGAALAQHSAGARAGHQARHQPATLIQATGTRVPIAIRLSAAAGVHAIIMGGSASRQAACRVHD